MTPRTEYSGNRRWQLAQAAALLSVSLATLSFPAGAMISLTAALDGTVTVWRPDGTEYCLPVTEFVTGQATNALRPGEILRSVRLPAAALAGRTAFRKLAPSPLGRSGIVVIGRRELPADQEHQHRQHRHRHEVAEGIYQEHRQERRPAHLHPPVHHVHQRRLPRAQLRRPVDAHPRHQVQRGVRRRSHEAQVSRERERRQGEQMEAAPARVRACAIPNPRQRRSPEITTADVNPTPPLAHDLSLPPPRIQATSTRTTKPRAPTDHQHCPNVVHPSFPSR